VNPPQTAILGMHKIADRPVAETARWSFGHDVRGLTYDHRIIDGREPSSSW